MHSSTSDIREKKYHFHKMVGEKKQKERGIILTICCAGIQTSLDRLVKNKVSFLRHIYINKETQELLEGRSQKKVSMWKPQIQQTMKFLPNLLNFSDI